MVKKAKKSDRDLLVNIVLDKSGSMQSVQSAVISGFNEFLHDQSNDEGKTFVSLTLFDTGWSMPYVSAEIEDVNDLDMNLYKPGGMTALYDAVGASIAKVKDALDAMSEAEKPEKVLFVVYTDGQENSSKEFTQAKINELVKKMRDDHEWEFVFLGADQDAWASGGKMGVASASHTVSYAGTSEGHVTTLGQLSNSTTKYRGSPTRTVTSFFDPEDQPKAKTKGTPQEPDAS